MTFLSSGAWIATLPKTTIEWVGRYFPKIPPAEIESVFEEYQIWRSSLDSSPPGKEMKAKLVSYKKALDEFHKKTRDFDQSGLDELIRRYTPIDGDREAFDNLKDALNRAQYISVIGIPNAIAKVKSGRRPTAEQLLAVSIAGIVRRAGYAVNAKQNGATVQILSAILDNGGAHRKDHRKIVEAALEKSGIA